MTKITRKAETSKCVQLGPDLFGLILEAERRRRAKAFIENMNTYEKARPSTLYQKY